MPRARAGTPCFTLLKEPHISAGTLSSSRRQITGNKYPALAPSEEIITGMPVDCIYRRNQPTFSADKAF
jgi:hypothetical protein